MLGLLEQFGMHLFQAGQPEQIISLAESVEVDTLAEHPQVYIYYLWALLSAHQFKKLNLITSQDPPPTLPDELLGDYLAIQTELTRDWRRKQSLAQQALHYLRPQDRLTRCLLHLNLARIAFYQTGETDHAIHLLTESLSTIQLEDAPTLWARMNDFLIAIHHRRGNLIIAEAICRYALEQCETYQRLGMSCAFHSQLGKILYEQNRLEETKDIVEIGRERSRNYLAHNSFAASSFVLARLLPPDQAAEIYADVRDFVGSNTYQLQRVKAAPYFRVAAEGWLAPLVQWDRYDYDPNTHAPSVATYYDDVVLAQRLTNGTNGKTRQAVHLLQHLLRIARQTQRQSDVIECSVLLCITYDKLGDHLSAMSQLREALNIARQTGHRRLLLDGGERVMHLLEEIAQQQHAHTAIMNIFESPLATNPPPGLLANPLTRRETDILQLVCYGYTNQEISQQLSISVSTTRWHLKNIYRKLQVTNRTRASLVGHKLGLVR